MITDGKKWHYLTLKSLSAFFRGITSQHDGDFYCLNCFHLYSTKNKLKSMKEYVMIMIIVTQKCLIDKILKYNHGEKSIKAPAIIYADLECLLEKMHSCQNNPEISYTEKKTKHTPSGYATFTSCSLDPAKNKLDSYKGEDFMEMFCKDLREHAMKIISHEKNDTTN